jgi:cell wall assembly regulator SMI1
MAENADGVVVARAGKGRFLRCDIVSNEGVGVGVSERGSTPLFARCQIRGNGEDVAADKKSKPLLEDCAVGNATTRTTAPPRGELGLELANIDVALDRVNPDARDALRAGASDATLAKLVKNVFGGKPVPEDLATFFRWHDGQSIAVALHADDNRTPMSVDEAIDAWRMLCDPKEDVRKPWSNAWLPVLTNGAGDYVCFVTSGKGAGSLVEYWHTDTDRKTAYASFDAWADALSATFKTP